MVYSVAKMFKESVHFVLKKFPYLLFLVSVFLFSLTIYSFKL